MIVKREQITGLKVEAQTIKMTYPPPHASTSAMAQKNG